MYFGRVAGYYWSNLGARASTNYCLLLHFCVLLCGTPTIRLTRDPVGYLNIITVKYLCLYKNDTYILGQKGMAPRYHVGASTFESFSSASSFTHECPHAMDSTYI